MSAFPSLCVRSADLTPLLAQLCESLPSNCTHSDGLYPQTVSQNKFPSHKLLRVSYSVTMMKNIVSWAVVAHTFNPSTWEAEAGGSL